MTATPTQNELTLVNYKVGATEQANFIHLLSQSTSITAQILNRNFSNSSYRANYIYMSASATENKLSIYNCALNSEQPTNSIVMASDLTTTVWSQNDLRLRSKGAIRVFANHTAGAPTGDYINYASGDQDTYIGGYSVKLQCTNRIYLYYGNTRYYITCNSDGLVHCTQA